ncbi:hypothetical protein HDE_02249 [Halotydeus destructor]|nr:hypothetical protein HDE_02249 [Halotydeus destructor]
MAPSQYADLVQLTAQLNCSESTDEVKLLTIEKVLSKHKIKDDKIRSNYVQLGVLVICLIILAFMSGQVAILGKMYFRIFQDIRDFEYEKCALKVPRALQDAFLPPFNCSICSNLDSIPRRSNLCPEEFEAKYAYSGLPVIVSDGAANWTAMSDFDFEFFRELYTSAERDTLRPTVSSFRTRVASGTCSKL